MAAPRRLRPVGAPALAVLALFAWACAVALASQLLLNGGFEEGGAAPDHWLVYGGALSRASSPSRSGFSAALTSTSASTKWIYQTVAVTGGNPYTFSGYALKNDAQVGSVFLRIAWYSSLDGFGPELSHADSLQSLSDDNPQFRLLTTGAVTAPLSARSARVMGVLQPVSEAQAVAYFDDLSLEGEVSTPTPTATPTSTASPTTTPIATATSTPTATPSPTATPAAAPTATPTPSPSATATVTATPSPSPTATAADPTATATPSPSPTPLVPGPTPTPSPSPSPTPLPAATASPTPPRTPTPTPTATAGLLTERKVLVSEVMVDPTQNPEAANEWVELYNPASQPVDLAGWVLADNFASKALPQAVLGPGSFLVVAGKLDLFLASQPGFSGSVVGSPGGRVGNGLSNLADLVLLKDPAGRLMDSVNWGRPQASWPNYHSALWDPGLSPPPPGYTLVRAAGQEAALAPGAWAASPRASAGRANPPPEPSPTPSPTPTRTPTSTTTATPPATGTRTSTPAATSAAAATTTSGAARTSTPPGQPTVGDSPSPGLTTPLSGPVSTAARPPVLGGAVSVGPPSPSPAATIPSEAVRLPPPPFSPTVGRAPPPEQGTARPALDKGAPSDEVLHEQTARGLNLVPLLLMALPILGLALWLVDRLFP